ncbi:hypothetical protein RHMOL_Rhmol07G0279700 [Rhododendron molle]|uniref:Uncharacterized protein n=2 Tax=Rhododendron molle TaxID=49168 RepID=A0ACC0N7H4_RHOML|nr:hypothetical protein RHMOL_Rhmol07G0279700 [Rhododendron molle]KAI8548533.1 hypothetical protein RHMOL_Rhmol07G0279700 [Rhododendron molle]
MGDRSTPSQKKNDDNERIAKEERRQRAEEANLPCCAATYTQISSTYMVFPNSTPPPFQILLPPLSPSLLCSLHYNFFEMLDSNNAITDNGAEVKTQGAAEVGDNVEVASGSPLPGVKGGLLFKENLRGRAARSYEKITKRLEQSQNGLLQMPASESLIGCKRCCVTPDWTPFFPVDNDDINDDDGDGNSDMTTTTMTFQTRKLDKR